MNPIRDREPEEAADIALQRIKRGDLTLVGRSGAHFAAQERKYPIQSWRIGLRSDGKDGSSLMYWVYRGGGYPSDLEEEVFLDVARRDQTWTAVSFGAIY